MRTERPTHHLSQGNRPQPRCVPRAGDIRPDALPGRHAGDGPADLCVRVRAARVPRQGDGGHVDLAVLGPVTCGLRHPQAARCARCRDRAGRGVCPGSCHVRFLLLFRFCGCRGLRMRLMGSCRRSLPSRTDRSNPCFAEIH